MSQNKPPIDPSDMSANQKDLLGVDSFQVKDPTLGMKIDQNQAVSAQTNAAMTKDAPNLPFKLFGIEKLFKKKDVT